MQSLLWAPPFATSALRSPDPTVPLVCNAVRFETSLCSGAQCASQKGQPKNKRTGPTQETKQGRNPRTTQMAQAHVAVPALSSDHVPPKAARWTRTARIDRPLPRSASRIIAAASVNPYVQPEVCKPQTLVQTPKPGLNVGRLKPSVHPRPK